MTIELPPEVQAHLAAASALREEEALARVGPLIVEIVPRAFLENAQFRDEMRGARAGFHRPPSWQ